MYCDVVWPVYWELGGGLALSLSMRDPLKLAKAVGVSLPEIIR